MSSATKTIYRSIVWLLLVSVSFFAFTLTATAQPTPQINYQGKLTDSTGLAVTDGDYNMRFWLLQNTGQATSSALWTEELTGSNQVTVTNGLFSVMLGSTSALTSVDFNQPLYLGVEIGGTGGTPSWDGEMLPRKPLGTVPAAFESYSLGGVASSSFLRSDQADTLAATEASTLLTINQSGSGDILNVLDGGTEVFTVTDGGNVGIGTATPSAKLTVAGDVNIIDTTSPNGGLSLNGATLATGSTTANNYFFAGATSTSFSSNSNYNVGFGEGALNNLGANADGNIAIGNNALFGSSTSLMTGGGNVALGASALRLNTTGSDNSALGTNALLFNTTGSDNNAFGLAALGLNTTGSYNNAFGRAALGRNTTGSNNSAVGNHALFGNTTGSNNSAIGYHSLFNNNGTGTIAVGYQVADNATAVDRGIFIGYDIDAFSTTEDNVLNIGNLIFGQNVDGTGTTLSSGSIGIGTSTPNYKLSVAGDVGLTGALYDNSYSAGTNGMILQTTGSGVQWVATSSLGMGDSTFLGLSDTPAAYVANALLFASTTAGEITQSSHIRTRNDGTQLQLGNTSLTTSNDTELVIGIDNISSGETSFKEAIEVFEIGTLFSGSATRTGNHISLRRDFSVFGGATLAVNGALASFSDDCDGAGTCVSSANVLELTQAYADNTGAVLNLTSASTNGGLVFRANDDGTLTDTTPFVIDANGNVGVGTTTPSAKLTVAGDVNIIDTTSPNGGLSLNGATLATGSTTANNYFFAGATSTSFSSNSNYNVGFGEGALNNLGANADGNIAIGNNALFGSSTSLMTGGGNVALGASALRLNTTGSDNSALGTNALLFNTTGSDNNAFGLAALGLNTTGSYNNAFGRAALGVNTTGSDNNAIGNHALFSNTAGSNNNVLGDYALFLNTGTGTIAIGSQVADNALTVDRGIFIGNEIDAFSTTEDDVLNIGNLIFGQNVDGTGTTLSSGNIGIGTSSPASKLDVWGDFRVGTSGTPTFFTSAALDRVGIGTTTPNYKLSVAGDFGLTGALYDNSYSAGTNGMVLQTTGSGAQWVATSSLGIDTTLSVGTDNQIPFVNVTNDDLEYSSSLTFDGNNLNLGGTNVGLAFQGTRFLYASTTNDSVAFGEQAGLNFTSNTTANVAIGYLAALNASAEAVDQSVFVGARAGQDNTGADTVFIGYNAGKLNSGDRSIALGTESGYVNDGSDNVFVGYRAGSALSGTSSTIIGAGAFEGFFFGDATVDELAVNNTALGFEAGAAFETGADNNVLIGYRAADNLTTGANNIVLGYDLDLQDSTQSNTLNIGNLLFGTGIDGTGTTISSGNIGIGTSSPASKLDVWGDFRVGTSGSPTLFTDTSSNWIGIGTTSKSVIATTTERLTIAGGGVIANNPTNPTIVGGVDTAGSAYAVTLAGRYAYVADVSNGLEIIDVSDPTNPTIVGGVDTAGSAYAVTLAGRYAYVADSSNGLEIIDIGGSEFSSLFAGALGATQANFDQDLTVGQNALVNSNLNVGNDARIGGLLSIQGYSSSTDTLNQALLSLGGNTERNSFMSFLGGVSSTTQSVWSVGLNQVDGSFRIASSSGLTNNSHLTILADGNIGIGTTTPNYKLSVAGDLGLTGALYDNSYSAGTNGMVLQTTGSGVQWVATSSLGFTDTDTTLSVGTDNQIPFVNGTNDDLEYSGNLTFDGSTLSVQTTGTSDILNLFETGGNEVFTVLESGNVGIGTSTPEVLLSVVNSGDGASMLVKRDNGIGVRHSAGFAEASIIFENTGDFSIRSANETNILSNSATVGTQRLTILGSNGNVGIGTTTPTSFFSLDNRAFSGAGVVGMDQFLETENTVDAAVQLGNRLYLNASNTATSTLVGSLYQVADDTELGNTIRGLEVQTERGSNTQGENTALSGFARTFGVRGVTEGDAGSSFEPAGGFFETRGTTQGNAVRGFSSSITSASLLSLFQDTSAFTGTGLEMNFGNTTGDFSSTSSKYLDFQNAGTSVFTVSAFGTTTIGDGTTNNMAGLQIGYGGICVDNDGTCSASTTGRITSVESQTGNSDLAEMYFSDQTLLPGELVVLRNELSVRRATADSDMPVLGVVSTKPGLTLGFDDTSTRSGETGYPLALSGRVPVKLSTENGPIQAGDSLMLSSLPGVAMKADGTGVIVGIALEDFDETRMYSDTYINQFGDDIAEPDFTPITTNTDPRINDGCYYSGGAAAGEAPCVPLTTGSVDEQIAEANELAAAIALDESLAELSAVESETDYLSDGTTVQVGQVVMFVDRVQRLLEPEQLAVLDGLLSTSTSIQTDSANADTLYDRLVTLADSFVAGVLSVFEVRADRVETEELCVDGVCVTGDDLRTLLDAAANQDNSAAADTASDQTTGDEQSDSAAGAGSIDSSDTDATVDPTDGAPIATSTSPTDVSATSTATTSDQVATDPMATSTDPVANGATSTDPVQTDEPVVASSTEATADTSPDASDEPVDSGTEVADLDTEEVVEELEPESIPSSDELPAPQPDSEPESEVGAEEVIISKEE